MARVAWCLVLLGLCGVGAATVAAAQVAPASNPSPDLTYVPHYLNIVGRGPNGAPDSLKGTYVVEARDYSNRPMVGSRVMVDLSGCPDIRIDQEQWPSLTVHCAQKIVAGFTDAQGKARFCIVGSGTNVGASNGAGADGAQVTVDGWMMGLVTVAVFDQDGAVTNPGVGLTDAIACLRDWGSGTYYGRSDVDHDGAIGLPDFIRILQVWGGGSSVFGPNELCP